jgi:hypothetical protein
MLWVCGWSRLRRGSSMRSMAGPCPAAQARNWAPGRRLWARAPAWTSSSIAATRSRAIGGRISPIEIPGSAIFRRAAVDIMTEMAPCRF